MLIALLAGLLCFAPQAFLALAQMNPAYCEWLPFHHISRNDRQVLPFDYIHHQIVLHLNVNGRQGVPFFLDSGSSSTMLAQSFVRDTHLSTTQYPHFKLVSRDAVQLGITAARHVHISGGSDSWVIGDVSKELVTGNMPVIDMSNIDRYLKVPIDGILGYDYIRHYPVLINYAYHTVTIFPDKKLHYRGNGVRLIPLKGTLPTIRATLTLADGRKVNARLTLDTGSDEGLELNAPFGVRYHLGTSGKHGSAAAPDFGPTYHQINEPIRSLQIGSIVINNPEASLAVNVASGALDSSTSDGDIGNEILESYRVLFDLPRNLIVLEPQEPADAKGNSDSQQ